MKRIVLFLLFIIAVVLEGSLTTIPFVLCILTIMSILRINTWILYGLAFTSGLYLDVAQVRILGITSLLYSVFLLIIMLYERKFETNTFQFAVFATGVGSFLFLTIFQQAFIVVHVVLTIGIGIILFTLFRKEVNPKNRYGETS